MLTVFDSFMWMKTEVLIWQVLKPLIFWWSIRYYSPNPNLTFSSHPTYSELKSFYQLEMKWSWLLIGISGDASWSQSLVNVWLLSVYSFEIVEFSKFKALTDLSSAIIKNQESPDSYLVLVWRFSMSGVIHLSIKDYERWSSNIVSWLKSDTYITDCRLSALEINPSYARQKTLSLISCSEVVVTHCWGVPY